MNRQPKKKSMLLRVLVIVLIILLLVASGTFAFVQLQLNKINRVGVTQYLEDLYERDTDADDTVADDELNWGDVEDVVAVKGVVNILLVGQDTRVEGERARSDSMILLSINKNTKQMTMVSLMRDLYVQIPGYNNNKMNAAFQFGGFELLDATVEENFGVPVDYNVEVDFNGFKDIIDTVDGVDIELSQEEADYLNRGLKGNLTAGMNHLNGEEALAYARTRHVGRYDFQRTYRQRTVLTAMFNKLRTQEWSSLLKVYDAVADDITTDLSNTDILSIGLSAYLMGVDHLNSYRLPTDDNYRGEVVRGLDALVIQDWDKARELLKAFLYSDDAGASLVEAESYS